jgi:tyrosyl-tRNA synthetase
MKGYSSQIGKILDISRTEVRYNSEWLGKLSAKELLNLQTKFTAQQMIQRRNFKERWQEGKEIGLHELNYPLLQGYDSVAVKADVELGGSDQLFNLLVGRDLQEMFKQEPQNVITLKMLPGLDGRKMSTTWGNVINISDEANDMFGKVMSMKDEVINEYFLLATSLSLTEVKEKQTRMDRGENPRDLKMELGWEIVKMYYDEKTADKAQDNFIKQFQKKEIPEDVQEIYLKESKRLADVLVEGNVIESKSEARRLGEQGGLSVDGQSVKADFLVDKDAVVKIGKRRIVKIIFEKK